MAHVQKKATWDVDRNVEALHATLLTFFRKQKMEIKEDEGSEPHSFCAVQGTQIGTRLLGGWFVPTNWLPKQFLVTFREKRQGIVLRVTAEDTLGFGIMDPLLRSKYEDFFKQLFRALDVALEKEENPEAEPTQDETIQEQPSRKPKPKADPGEGITGG
jgi:hypothetical protein